MKRRVNKLTNAVKQAITLKRYTLFFEDLN